MTHDELLAEIDQWLFHSTAASDEKNKAIGFLKAFRAVVELHKPVEGDLTDAFICDACSISDYEADYPCETIQAIEKELG